MRRSNASRSGPALLERTIAVALGVVLARSAFAHLANPYAFLDAYLAYDLLDGYPAITGATLIPALQLSLAVALIVGWWSSESHALAAVLFTAFVVIQLSAMIRKLDISCGCFGTAASVRVGRSTILFAAICAVGAILGWVLARRER